MVISGTLVAASFPLSGTKAVVSVDDATLEAHVMDYDGNALATWQLLEQPYEHRSGFYLRTADYKVLVKTCHDCE